MLKQDVDFTFVDFDNSDKTGICLLDEIYSGVIYHYIAARVVEEGEVARLEFGFTIVHPGKHDIDDLQNDEKFHTIMGDILTHIMTEQIEDAKT